MDAAYDFHTCLIKEVKAFCKEHNYNITKISFVSAYDANIKDDLNEFAKSNSDFYFKIIQRDDSCEAVIFSGTYIELH